jgi:hypothetical protein
LIANAKPNIVEIGAIIAAHMVGYRVVANSDAVYIASYEENSDISIEYLNLKTVDVDDAQWLLRDLATHRDLTRDFTLLYCWYTVTSISNKIFPDIVSAFLQCGWETYVGIQDGLRLPGLIFLSCVAQSPDWRWDYHQVTRSRMAEQVWEWGELTPEVVRRWGYDDELILLSQDEDLLLYKVDFIGHS